VDSGVSYSGGAISSMTGLTHLEGQTVAIFTNGVVRSTGVVSGGAVAVPAGTTTASVGLAYTSTAETVPLVVSAGPMETRGKRIRPFKSKIMFNRTVGGSASGDGGTTWETIENQYATANALFTGVKDINIRDSDELIPTIAVRQTNPAPMTINSIITELSLDGP
jgi:hypothetical protein